MGRGSYEYHLIEVKYAFTLIYYVTPVLLCRVGAPIGNGRGAEWLSAVGGSAISKVMKISKTMTIKEAAAVWNDPRADFLEKWGEMLNVQLDEITRDHLTKYQRERIRESPQCIVDVEVRALTELLKHAGLSRLTGDEVA
jgi:hypothetical protein